LPDSAIETIYIPLEDHRGWLPVLAARRAGGVFQILSRNDDPAAEPWAYSPGCLVRCEEQVSPSGTHLVAVALVPPPVLQVVK